MAKKKTQAQVQDEEMQAFYKQYTDDEVLEQLISQAKNRSQLDYITRKNHVDDPTKIAVLERKIESKDWEINLQKTRILELTSLNRSVQETVNYMGKLMKDQNFEIVQMLADKLASQAHANGRNTQVKDKNDHCDYCD